MQPPISHFASPAYWSLYRRLPTHVRSAADKTLRFFKPIQSILLCI